MLRLRGRFGVLLLGIVASSSSPRLPAASTGATAPELARLEQRIKDRPGDFIALTMLGQLHAQQARETGDLGAYGKAEAAFNGALGEFPEFAGALGGLASVRMALHRFSEARDLAQKILRREPGSVDARLLMGDAQLALGNDEAAAQIFAQLPDLPAVFARRADLARLRGHNDEALRLLLRAADESQARGEAPDNLSWYHVRAGEMLFRRGNFEMAEEQYRLAAEPAPQSYNAAEHIAELRGAQGKCDEALALYQKLIAQSNRPDLQQALGDLYLFMRKPEQAKPWHDKALAGYLASVERGGVHFIHHLAGFYADAREDGREAVKWARKDLALRPTAAAHEALAWALYRAGEFAKSRAEIDAALASGIKDAHISYHAGLIYSAAGDLERGQKFLRETAMLNPHYNSFHVHR